MARRCLHRKHVRFAIASSSSPPPLSSVTSSRIDTRNSVSEISKLACYSLHFQLLSVFTSELEQALERGNSLRWRMHGSWYRTASTTSLMSERVTELRYHTTTVLTIYATPVFLRFFLSKCGDPRWPHHCARVNGARPPLPASANQDTNTNKAGSSPQRNYVDDGHRRLPPS